VGLTLTLEQELRAADVGYRRQVNAVRHGWKPRHVGGSRWGGHIEGACAELAGSLWTGLPWTGEKVWDVPPAERVPDLGTNVEVRWTAPTARDLFLYLDALRDKPERFFLLVVGFAPDFEIIGWIKGENARRNSWLVVYPEREVYRVPAAELHPVERREHRAA
jgi:hypothetical protein